MPNTNIGENWLSHYNCQTAPETALCPLLPWYCVFLSLKYAFGIISMFFTLVRCPIILSRLFLSYLHPCFLPYVQIYWISVRLLMSHKKCPIWQVLFIIKFGTLAFFCIVLYSLQVCYVLLQMSKMSHPFFSFLSNTSCINRLKKSFLLSFSFFSYRTNSIIMGPRGARVVLVE